MARKRHPTGPLWTVDDPWKQRVKKRMGTLDPPITPADLARRIGVSKSAITVLFRSETKQSRLVPKIHKALDMVDETSAVSAVAKDDLLKRFLRAWVDLTQAQREHLIATAQLLADKG